MSYVSFERTDAEGTVAHRWNGGRTFGHRRRCVGFLSLRLVFGQGIEKCRRWYEEKIPGDGAAEIKQPVVVAGWPADEHVLEHLFNRAGRTAVSDEISAEFTVARLAEGHVVAQNLDLFSVFNDRGKSVVR